MHWLVLSHLSRLVWFGHPIEVFCCFRIVSSVTADSVWSTDEGTPLCCGGPIVPARLVRTRN